MRPAPALIVIAALAWFASAAPASPDSTTTGTVCGMVKDSDGKPVVGLRLRLERRDPIGGDGGKKGSRNEGRTAIVGQAVTDANGQFVMKLVSTGTVMLIAGNKEIGWIYQEVEIKAGEETKLDDLQLVLR